MFKLFILFFIHILLLPLKVFVSILEMCLWHPHCKFDKSRFTPTKLTNEEKFNEYINSLKVEDILNDGDGAKFLGLASAANTELFDELKCLWDADTFHRCKDRSEKDLSFSTDMMSGMLEAIYHRYRAKGLTEEEKANLKTIWNQIVFEGKPFKIRHKEDFSRGTIVDWYSMMPDFIAGMAFCAVGFEILGEKKYKTLYHILKILSYPMRMCYTYGIWQGKVYLLNWFTTHSSACFAYIGYKLTEDKIFEHTLKELFKKNPWNGDIGGYLYSSNRDPQAKKIAMLCLNNYGSTAAMPKIEKEKYFTFKGMKFKELSNTILSYQSMKGAKYLYESRLIEPKIYKRSGWYCDFLHLYALVYLDK
jgi:hypothetical protein